MRAIEFLTEGATDVMEHLEEIVKESQQFLGQYPSIKTFMSEAVSDLINYPSKEQSKIHQQYDISRNKKYADQTDRQSGQQKTDIDYITDYTAGDSYDINDYLHRHYRKKASKNDLAKYKKNLQSIDRALTVQRLTKPLTVYTAVPESPANAWTIYGADIRLPIRLHLPAYTSTSTSLESVIEFASRSHLAPDSVDHKRHPPRNSKKAPDDIDTNQIIMLQIPVGTPAASVKGISDYPDENEILMPRGLDIEISPNPTVIKYGDYVWHAQVLGHNPIQIIASEGVQNIEEMAGEKNKCPPATQDITLNLKNRQKAIDEYGYGPLNPDMPNRKFWMKKVDEWNLDSIQEAQQSLCGNCAAFDIRQETLDCIAQGIDSGNPQDAQGVIDAGDLGYCKFLKFKCASRRTCDAWVTGGPLTDKQGMAEAPLADYQPIGDFDKPGPFRGADKKLIPHPVNQLKAQRFFEKTPYDFRLFFSNIPGTGKYSEYGVMDPDTVKIIFGDAGEQIVAGHENAITVVYVGNSGDSKVMLTPWMMAHRLGHAIQVGARGQMRNQQQPWKAGEDHFFGQVNSMLEEYYGKSGQPGGNLKAELTPEYNALFNAMGTQRSSRSGEIRRPYEFLYEIFAQYLGTGTVTFNALPANLGYGRRAWGNPSRYLNIKPEYRDETVRKQAAEVLSYDMELMFNDALSNVEGKILVM